MAEIVGGILVLLGLLFLGYGLIWPFSSEEIGTGERLVLGLGISLGLIPLVLFYALLAGAHLRLFSPQVLIAGASLGFALLLVDLLYDRTQGARAMSSPASLLSTRYQAVLIAVITVLLIEKVVFVTVQGLSLPSSFWDAVETWSYKAKVLYFAGRIDLHPQSEAFLGGWKPHYPLGLSLFRAWTATLLGGWSEKAVALHSMAGYFLLFALVWIRLSKRIGRWLGFLFAYLVVSLPLMVHHAYAGYADLMLSLFFTGCLIYGYEYLSTREPLSAVVSVSFLISSLFTKNEGLVLIFPVLMTTILLAIWQRRLSLRSGSLYTLFAILLILPWVILKAHFGLGYSPGGEKPSVFQINLIGLPQLFSVVFGQGSFNLFGLFFIVSACLYGPIWWSTDLRFLAFPVLLFLAAVLGVFLFTTDYVFLANQWTVNRSLMLFMPSYIYLVGLSIDRRPWGNKPASA
jgi:hypothetical protein